MGHGVLASIIETGGTGCAPEAGGALARRVLAPPGRRLEHKQKRDYLMVALKSSCAFCRAVAISAVGDFLIKS